MVRVVKHAKPAVTKLWCQRGESESPPWQSARKLQSSDMFNYEHVNSQTCAPDGSHLAATLPIVRRYNPPPAPPCSLSYWECKRGGGGGGIGSSATHPHSPFPLPSRHDTRSAQDCGCSRLASAVWCLALRACGASMTWERGHQAVRVWDGDKLLSSWECPSRDELIETLWPNERTPSHRSSLRDARGSMPAASHRRPNPASPHPSTCTRLARSLLLGCISCAHLQVHLPPPVPTPCAERAPLSLDKTPSLPSTLYHYHDRHSRRRLDCPGRVQ